MSNINIIPRSSIQVPSTDPTIYSIGSCIPTDCGSIKAACKYVRQGLEQRSIIWKIFSSEPVEGESLKTLFKGPSISKDSEEGDGAPQELHQDDWLAYPEYDLSHSKTILESPDSGNSNMSLPPFILYQSDRGAMYYLNGIEWAASAMEMSIIGAKNLSNLCARWAERNLIYSNPNPRRNRNENGNDKMKQGNQKMAENFGNTTIDGKLRSGDTSRRGSGESVEGEKGYTVL